MWNRCACSLKEDSEKPLILGGIKWGFISWIKQIHNRGSQELPTQSWAVCSPWIPRHQNDFYFLQANRLPQWHLRLPQVKGTFFQVSRVALQWGYFCTRSTADSEKVWKSKKPFTSPTSPLPGTLPALTTCFQYPATTTPLRWALRVGLCIALSLAVNKSRFFSPEGDGEVASP